MPKYKINEWLDCYAVVNGKFNDEICERVPFKMMVKTRPGGGMQFLHEALTLEITKPSDQGFLRLAVASTNETILTTFYKRLNVGMQITIEATDNDEV